jgi:hypothetical protein
LEIWRTYSPKGIKLTKNIEINTILFADDQILLAENEDDLQRAVTTLNKVMKTYNMKSLAIRQNLWPFWDENKGE